MYFESYVKVDYLLVQGPQLLLVNLSVEGDTPVEGGKDLCDPT
jgi:hypothetical protein